MVFRRTSWISKHFLPPWSRNMCNSLASIAAITYGNFSCNFVVTQVACWETLWSVSHWTTCNSTCLAAMDENSAEEGHYNNIIWKRLAGEISLEDTAKPCDNLQGWCYTMQQLGHLSQSRKKPCAMFNWFLLLATIAATKKLWGISFTAKFLSCKLCCKNIVRQVAQKIAQCYTGFTTYNHHRQCLSILPPLVHGQYLLAQEMLPAQSHGPLWNLLQATSLEWTWAPSSWNNNNNYYYCYLDFSD